MRNPLTDHSEITDKDKVELTKLTDYLSSNYMPDMERISLEMFGNEGSKDGYLIVATLISVGYALKMHEIENLEYDFMQRAVEKPDAN